MNATSLNDRACARANWNNKRFPNSANPCSHQPDVSLIGFTLSQIFPSYLFAYGSEIKTILLPDTGVSCTQYLLIFLASALSNVSLIKLSIEHRWRSPAPWHATAFPYLLNAFLISQIADQRPIKDQRSKIKTHTFLTGHNRTICGIYHTTSQQWWVSNISTYFLLKCAPENNKACSPPSWLGTYVAQNLLVLLELFNVFKKFAFQIFDQIS